MGKSVYSNSEKGKGREAEIIKRAERQKQERLDGWREKESNKSITERDLKHRVFQTLKDLFFGL